MLNSPQPPRTRIVRQLECVCCRESFSIAEDDPVRQNGRTENWQLSSDHYPITALRYHPYRAERPMAPITRAKPIAGSAGEKWSDTRRFLNCPRCGTDNRNWLHTLHPDDTQRRAIIDAWQGEKRDIVWIVFIIGIAILAVVTVAITISLVEFSDSLFAILLIFLSVLIGGVITVEAPAVSIVHIRRELRRHRLTLVALILILAAAALTYRSRPEGGGINSQTLLLTITVFLVGVVPLFSIAGAWQQMRIYRHLREIKPSMDKRMISPAIERWLKYTVLFLTPPLVLYLFIPSVSHVKEMIFNQGAAESSWIGMDGSFFGEWIKFAILSNVIGFVFGLQAANSYINQVDPQLPRPLFSSIANMTRVVVWEAKHALEIGDETDYIQWVGVERNLTGGITLKGVFREQEPTASAEEFPTAKVRAQRYELVSDQWGRIIEAKVKTMPALKRPYRPSQRSALGEELFDRQHAAYTAHIPLQ